jgi:2-dehydropantoate 2-reductase
VKLEEEYGLRIAVIGAGALGTVFGGFLARAGHDVDLLGRPWHLDRVAQEGLLIEGIWGEHRVSNCRVCTDLDQLSEGYDLVLFSVKSFDTAAVALQAKRAVGEGTLVLSLQNGLGNIETLAEIFGPTRCGAGRVIFGAEIIEPGRVRVTVCADDVVLGPVSPDAPNSERIRTVAELIRSAGIPCRYESEVQAYLWAKAIYNCALNPLGALLGVNYGALADRPETRAVINAVIREVFAVAVARDVLLPWKTADEYLNSFYGQLVPPTREHRPSMLQDLERGRRTEIEALNGRVVGYGREASVSTPVNETIANLIRFRGQTHG